MLKAVIIAHLGFLFLNSEQIFWILIDIFVHYN